MNGAPLRVTLKPRGQISFRPCPRTKTHKGRTATFRCESMSPGTFVLDEQDRFPEERRTSSGLRSLRLMEENDQLC